MIPGNKLKLSFYFKYGTCFYGNNSNSYDGNYKFVISTFYVKVYKNSVLINTYTYNLNGTYSNSVVAYGFTNVKTWLNESTILVDEAICHDATTYDIKVNYSQVVTYNEANNWQHCGMVFNDTDSKFSNYESIPSILTGKTSTNFFMYKCFISKRWNSQRSRF